MQMVICLTTEVMAVLNKWYLHQALEVLAVAALPIVTSSKFRYLVACLHL